jgi:alkanesulfonate monooxygenase SsuD/methylene tetrahydromethanopterin reductase-like flavin-dependent oxidoreductase (luciferase family)
LKVSYLCMTGYDGPAPGIEIWPASPEYCDSVVAQKSMRRSLDMAGRAEELGFDWVSVSEHHYAPYMMTPNPLIMAAAISQRTSRVRIALLGPLVPLLNPVRLAEEIAMLDALSGGRTEVLFLRGTPNEHGTYDTVPEHTRAMTQEGIDLILKAWREREPFSWHSKHYNFKTISVWPSISQKPNPPVFGSGNSDESVIFAAERRMGIAFSFAPAEVVKKWIALYRIEAAKVGWEPTPNHILYRGIAYVAGTDEQAGADMTAHFGAKAEESARLQSKTMGGPPQLPLVLKPYFVGSPATVIERFQTMRECGVGITDLAFVIGTPEQQLRSVELFARKVIPVVHAWDSTTFLAESSRAGAKSKTAAM